jgi:hypothetical protein
MIGAAEVAIRACRGFYEVETSRPSSQTAFLTVRMAAGMPKVKRQTSNSKIRQATVDKALQGFQHAAKYGSWLPLPPGGAGEGGGSERRKNRKKNLAEQNPMLGQPDGWQDLKRGKALQSGKNSRKGGRRQTASLTDQIKSALTSCAQRWISRLR